MGKRELFACDADSIPDDDANRHDADHYAGSAGLRGLLVRDPYASQLLDGEEIWEIRGRSTHIRGPILIVESGTGQLFGTADLVRVLGPLELEDLVDASELPRQEREEFRNSGLPYAKTYAYVFSNPRRFKRPIPYPHHSGAVTWVRLPEVDLGAVRYASSPTGRLSARWSEFLTSPLYDLAPVGYDAGRGPNGRLRVRVLQLSRCAPVTFRLWKPGETRVTVTRGGVIGRDATFQCT